MTYSTAVNYSDDTHMKSGIFYTRFQDTIWNVIPILHCPFKDMKEVKMSYLLLLYTHAYIVCTYIYLNIKCRIRKPEQTMSHSMI